MGVWRARMALQGPFKGLYKAAKSRDEQHPVLKLCGVCGSLIVHSARCAAVTLLTKHRPFCPQNTHLACCPVPVLPLPRAAPAMHMQPGSLVYRRAKFATHNLWVTPYDDDQMYPAGAGPREYPQHPHQHQQLLLLLCSRRSVNSCDIVRSLCSRKTPAYLRSHPA